MDARWIKASSSRTMHLGGIKERELMSFRQRARLLILAVMLFFSLSPVSGSDWIYTVVDGDNLWDFSEKYLDSVLHFDKLRKLNNIKNPRRLRPGSWLRVPMKWIRSNAVPASLTDFEGQVQLVRADGSQISQLKPGVSFYLGDTLRTGSNSSAAIRFADGSVLTLHSHSEMRFDHLSAHGETGMVDSRLNLIRGRVQTKVRPSAGPGSRFEIYTPSAISAVRGTLFRTAVSASSEASNVEVLEGNVAVSASEKQRLIPAGFGTRVEKGKAPAPAVALLPAPDFRPIPEVVRRIDWRLEWRPIEGAVNYRIEVSRDKELAVLIGDQLSVQTHFSLPELPDGRYWLRVRGIDANGLEGKSRVAYVLLDAQPQPPISLSPQDGITLYGKDAALQWTQPEDADGYLLEIARDESFEQIVLRVADLKVNHYRAEAISDPGIYYWRVTTILDSELGPPGVVRSWQLKRELAAVESTIEADEERVTASWPHDATLQHYQVQLAFDKDFKRLELDQMTDQSEVSFDQLYGQVRYLRIRAIDEDGHQGSWGSVQRIEPPLDKGIWTVPILFILGLLFI